MLFKFHKSIVSIIDNINDVLNATFCLCKGWQLVYFKQFNEIVDVKCI